MAAARRKGKRTGGAPILGYDVAGGKLVPNEAETDLVRLIFDLYTQREGLLPVVKEINGRGWRNKLWTTKKGAERGGRPFNKNTLYYLLTNVTYIGKVRYKDEIYEGEQEAIIDDGLWQRVQAKLKRNGRAGGAAARNRRGALLKGLLRCAACDCGMVHTYTSKGQRRYSYYVCLNAQKRGWDSCPSNWPC
jgi:site-specific DNA recombinase